MCVCVCLCAVPLRVCVRVLYIILFLDKVMDMVGANILGSMEQDLVVIIITVILEQVRYLSLHPDVYCVYMILNTHCTLVLFC